MASNTTGVRIVPEPGAGSLVSPGNGYPTAPHDDTPVSHTPAAGIPEDVNTYSQGVAVMVACTSCGRAYAPDEFGEHNQCEGLYNNEFGSRSFGL
jgi:hypothetical protein